MPGLRTLVSLLSLTLSFSSSLVNASPCIAFDSNMNLLAFNLNSKDWNAGTQDTWTSSSGATDITKTGRPPFDGTNPQCFLAQFFNAIYVLGADNANPSSIYIYDAAKLSWTTQAITTGTFDMTSYAAILDHDTNLFYALSKGELFSLDFGTLVAANSSAIAWNDIEKAAIDTTNYTPVMALAQNHIHFLDVPGVAAGLADIYVIHFDSWQTQPQGYPLPDGSAGFPAAQGKATSFFQPADVQHEFAYIPSDGSATYVINVETNSTQQLAGPSTVDSSALYFAGITSLVQLASSGAVSYLPYLEGTGNFTTNAAAKWSTVASLASVAPPGAANSTTTGGSSTSGGSASGSGGAKSTGSGTSSGSNPSASSGAIESRQATATLVSGMFVLAAVVVAFC